MADKLSIADIEAYAKKAAGKYPNFKVLGVHQEGNSAEVYYQYQKAVLRLMLMNSRLYGLIPANGTIPMRKNSSPLNSLEFVGSNCRKSI